MFIALRLLFRSVLLAHHYCSYLEIDLKATFCFAGALYTIIEQRAGVCGGCSFTMRTSYHPNFSYSIIIFVFNHLITKQKI